MTSVALYRKYRPRKFSEVVGQEPIVQALEGALASGQVAHAYLFSGPRGTGKTSVARILADSLKCSQNDLYEIDGASNRGIDDVRELRDAARTLPFESPFKVYIIDEVHMLTTPAFNALLKTLEEPPAHVVFILATTANPNELPDTIVSRCQTFQFKKPTVEILKKHIENIAKKEGYTIDKEAADLIAFMGDGAFRDALGILQKAMASAKDNKIVASEVRLAVGVPDSQLVSSLTEAVVSGNLELALSYIRKASQVDLDMKVLAKLLMREIRLIMLLRFAPTLDKSIVAEVGEEEYERLNKLKSLETANKLPAILFELLNAYPRIGDAYIPELPLELALIKVMGK